MKYVLEQIQKAIDDQKPSSDAQVRIRLSGFDNPAIYQEICRYATEKYQDLDVAAVLAEGKYRYFVEHHADDSVLRSIKESGWLSGGKSLTYFRNLTMEEAQLIILMGTEAVDDQGGLSDIFFVDPSRLISELNGDFHVMFGLKPQRGREVLPLDAVIIDKMFKDLFSLVPLDICKLSDIIDSWGYLEDDEDFLNKFYEALPSWGLCKDGQWRRKWKNLRRTRNNVLQENYDFINRKELRKMNRSQYRKYRQNIERYPQTDDIMFPPDWDGWYKQRTKSYEELSSILLDFIAGVEVEKNRQLLRQVDFTIIDDVLNLKIKDINPPVTEKKIKVSGAPLSAMTHAVYAVAGVKSTDPFDSIRVIINSVELVDAIDPQLEMPESEQLARTWKRICVSAGGVFDYMNTHGIAVDDRELQIVLEPDSIFSPSCAFSNVKQGNVSAASANKKLNKVSFELIRYFDGSPIEKGSTRFEWTFPSNAGWIQSFADLVGLCDDWEAKQISSFVPVFEIDNYNSLMNARSREEFLDILESSSLKDTVNLLDSIQKKAKDTASQAWFSEFSKLGGAFVDFVNSICEKGFFGDLVEVENSKILAFNSAYVKFGEKIYQQGAIHASSGLEWVFNDFINAFAILERANAVIQDENQDGCIIPPFHPAILQKCVDQAVFLYDGCREIVRHSAEKERLGKICQAIDELEEMSEIHEGVDIFPGRNDSYFGTTRTFADYCVCGTAEPDRERFISAIQKKDDVYDDDFKETSFNRMDAASRMYLDVIESYLKALPDSRFNLTIAVVNPSDLQPVVAAIYSHIKTQKAFLEKHAGQYAESQRIAVQLHVLVRPENRGGKSYLTYWVNSFFNEDEKVDVKIYLNEWTNSETLLQLLSEETDILFLQDILLLDRLSFVEDTTSEMPTMQECRFPIVFKPIPAKPDTVKRRIELTQKQFTASTVHSNVVRFSRIFDSFEFKPSTVVKELSIDHDRRRLILRLHDYSNWVVCVDGGMDGALLRDDTGDKSYEIIGFSTGKGRQGQYNLTITARASIIDAVNSKLKNRLWQAFSWDQEKIDKAADNCMREARRLDGVSLLSAINPKGYKINEFLAYVLTSEMIRKRNADVGVSVIVHLDSYPHWFNLKRREEDTKSRPDFLLVNVKIGEDKRIDLETQVIECKLASYGNSVRHKDKARKQVEQGVERLSELFDPKSSSIKRRYWYAQLYRALSFAQITFCSDDAQFDEYAKSMRSILEGNFTISWSGCVMGYWKDMQGDQESVVEDEMAGIEFHDVPQKMIQRLLLGDDSIEVDYVNVIGLDQDEEEAEDEKGDNDILDDELYEEEDEEPDTEKEEFMRPVRGSEQPEQQGKIDPTDDKPPREVKDEVQKQEVLDQQQENSVVEEPSLPQAEDKALKDIRVYIGKDRNGGKVYWEFGHPGMANRHLLITGTSGQGKTYSIQTMLKELSDAGIPSVIFDYTEGFRIDQLDPAFTKGLEDRIQQNVIYVTGVPINPFVRQEIEIAGMKCPEKISDVAQRLANIFKHVYKFGDQQFSAVYEAVRAGLQQYDTEMNMKHFEEKLKESSNPSAKTVLSKMQPFLDSVEFIDDPGFHWDSMIRANGTVTVIQLTHFIREIQVIITELMLWDAWHYNKKFGNKDTPFVVVLDEAQNLSHKENSPSAMILTEGRKFGWSAWFATQSLKVLDSDEIVRLQQAAYKLYFKPTDEELTTVAKFIDPTQSSAWTGALKNLKKGQAIISGDRKRPDGVFGHASPIVTRIASFEEREHET